MRRFDGGEIRGLAVRLKETIDDGAAAFARQVQRQAFSAERFAQLFQHFFGTGIAAVDLVDDDEAAQLAIAGEVHEAVRDRIHSGGGADDDRR